MDGSYPQKMSDKNQAGLAVHDGQGPANKSRSADFGYYTQGPHLVDDFAQKLYDYEALHPPQAKAGPG